jgi:hypothetical protein
LRFFISKLKKIGEAATQAERAAAAPDVDEWVKTSYIYDVTMPYGQLLSETAGGVVAAYTCGLERIAAHNSSLQTQYVYDGRGSVNRG